MTLNQVILGKWYRILDVPLGSPCQSCIPCMRLRVMEMGLFPGEIIKVESVRLDMWLISVYNGSTIAMREEEVKMVVVESALCD